MRLVLLFCLLCPLTSWAERALHLGLVGEPATLDPHKYNLRIEETVLNDLFMGLTTFNAAGEIVPGAAASWTTSEDGLTWTFTLREDLRWSDGRTLTAQDFAYAFRRLVDPNTAASLAYFMYPLRNAEAIARGELPTSELGVEAIAPTTLRLSLHAPYPHLPERLLYPTAYPVPAHTIAEHGEDWTKPANMVTNGAYRLADWQPQRHIKLSHNPEFRPAALSETIFYQVTSTPQNAYNRYRAGDIDAIATFPSGDLTTARERYAEDLRTSPLLSAMYLVFNTRTEPFDDSRVREALAIVVEQQTITDKVMRTGDIAAASFVPELVAHYDPPALPHASLSKSQRIDKAKQLLKTAGYGSSSPLSITLRYAGGTDAKRVNLAIAAFWRRLGVQVALHQSELRIHYGDLRRGDFEVALAGWIGESNPEHYLGLLHSQTGDTNYGAFADSTVDTLIDAARAEAKVGARHQLLRQAEVAAMKHYPVVPLYNISVRRLVNPQLDGWSENPRDIHPARFLSILK